MFKASAECGQPTFFKGDRRFRFLYVGGTIARKGFDLLVEAYLAEFKKEDRVCLVVKDHGTDAHYRGISMEQRIREAQADAWNSWRSACSRSVTK